MAVFNAGLTNEPFFDELKPIISKHIIGKGPVMDDLLERLRYFLQLPITATASEILAELGKLSTQIQGVIAAGSKEGATAKGIFDFIAAIKKNYAEVLQSLGLKPEATVEEAKAIIAAKGDTSGFVAKADYQKLLDQIAGRELDELIAKALVEGKITPATKDQMKAWAMKDRKSFDEYLGKVAAYSAVPLGQIKIATDKLGRGAGLTERDLEIAAKFGLTEDQLKKHNPAAD
jgi:phage I-like protein